MSPVQNFEHIAATLIASASSDKAVKFATEIAAKVRAKGDAWIESHVTELQVMGVPSDEIAPVADNRLYYLAKWQTALAK